MSNVRWEAKPFLFFFISIIAVLFVFACSTEKLSLSVQWQDEYKELADDGKDVQRRLKNIKEKFQKQNVTKNDSLVSAETFWLDMFEGMDSLFVTWNEIMDKKHDRLILLEEAANKNFSIWLAVIAAICTVLPVVLALHQNQTFDKQFQEYENKMNSENEKNKCIIRDIKEEINIEKLAIKKLNSRMCVTGLLDMTSRNLIMLNNLTELEVRENVLITCEKEVQKVLEILVWNIKESNKRILEYIDKWNESDTKIIINSYLCLACILREMTYRYESEFTGKRLIFLQQNRYLVSMFIQDLIDEKQDAKEAERLEKMINEMYGYVKAIKDIFSEELKKK